MDSQEAHIQLEQKALQISMLGAFAFVLLEFGVALLTHSQAVLMDSAYDLAESITIIVSFRLVPLLYKPSTEKRPFGYSPVETWFLMIKGFMLLAISAGLVVSNIQIILGGGHIIAFHMVAYFELFVAVISCLVIVWLKRINGKVASPLVLAEINGWIIDTISSLGMGVAFLLPAIIDTSWMVAVSPYLDQIVAVCLVIVVLPTPIRMIVTGMRDLLLMAPEQGVVDQIKEIANEIMARYEFDRQFSLITYDIVRMGRRLWVSIYVTPKKNEISIEKWSFIQDEIENALISEFNDAYVELLPEIE